MAVLYVSMPHNGNKKDFIYNHIEKKNLGKILDIFIAFFMHFHLNFNFTN